jgi:protein ImuB
VVVETQKNALRLTALDERAAAEGLEVGMTLADARARTPALTVIDADPAADFKLLARLAEACRRFTPSLALDPPDAVDLDLTGCASLFGGEARLLMAVRALMQRVGVSVKVAIADTPALAYAAARFGGGGLVAPGVREAVLAPMPVEALRLEPDAAAVLRQLGFKRIGQVLELPRSALARRLGGAMLDRLDQALGRRASALEFRLETPPLRAERRLFEPISEADQVLQVVGDLGEDLSVQLDGRGLGGRRFVLELFRMDGAVRRLEVAASRPLRHPPRITSLFEERLAGLQSGLQADFGFDQLRLTALQLAPTAAGAADLLQERDASAGAVEALADRITARGSAEVRRATAHDVHTPEDAAGLAPSAAAASPASAERFFDTPLRPLRLFEPPQPIGVAASPFPDGPPSRFVWRRIAREVVRAEGPERLEPEWARRPEHAAPRDYYRLEDAAGRRYWVFRLGRYDAPPALPPDAERESLREDLKPDHASPKPVAKLRLVHSRDEVASSAVGQAPGEVQGALAAAEGDGGAAATAAERRVHPAWFLHGLFG